MRGVGKHLGSHVLKSATECIPLLKIVVLYTPPKVTDLQHVIIVNKKILWLNVSVNEAILMKKVNASTSLDEEVEGLIFRESLLLSD